MKPYQCQKLKKLSYCYQGNRVTIEQIPYTSIHNYYEHVVMSKNDEQWSKA